MNSGKPHIAIIGAGMLGLAHALAAAERGYRVDVYERDSQALGASVRNFGLGLHLGHARGEMLELARASLQRWRQLLPELGIWYKQDGCLLLARNAQEADIIACFQDALGQEYDTQLLSSSALKKTVWQDGSRCTALSALSSPHEIGFASAQLIPRLSAWLQETKDVHIHYQCTVLGITEQTLHTARGAVTADHILLCSGHEFRHLMPHLYTNSGIRLCSLQMQELAIAPRHIAPTLLTGLSCLHYPAFQQIPELQKLTDAYQRQLQQAYPDIPENGIHLIIQQFDNPSRIIVGDTHHYGPDATVFQSEASDLILRELCSDVLQTSVTPLRRWQGVYASAAHPYQVLRPQPGLTAVNMTSGIGMSVGLALAAQVIESL